MNKIALIIKREYLTRVKKKSFIIMSIVGPLLFGAVFILPAWLSTMDESGTTTTIAVIDNSNQYAFALKNTDNLKFEILANENEESLKDNYESQYDGFLIISKNLLVEDAVKYYSDAAITIDVQKHIERNLKKRLEQEYIDAQNIDGLKEIIHHAKSLKVKLTTIKLGDAGEEQESSTAITMILSIAFSLLIYMFVLLYGTQVMRGVMEEKTNRIVEVIVSSVKPFQLMMGKIIGIAMVALTQFVIWIVLTFTIVSGISAVVGVNAVTSSSPKIGMIQQLEQEIEHANQSDFEKEFSKIITKIDWETVAWSLVAFVFYFIGGYLLYAALFAAVGSAIDSDTDSQQFVMPIMMPLILSIYVATAAFRNPGSDLAFWFSMIPFTSPVVMMARIPFNIPLWEILTSMGILVASFVAVTYVAGRIYRTGILMYGKKVSYKEMWKWFRESGR